MPSEHTLYVVATPIGHRQDLSLRAIEVLQSVGRIYAEDTRHSAALLRHHGIATPLSSLHEHNEQERMRSVVDYVGEVASAALISDAGTPLISDPGYALVRACQAAGVRVSPVPGPSALLAALSVSGLATDRFCFHGFPSARRGARQRQFKALARQPGTLVFYESPHRILESLTDLAEAFGEQREIALARELTKRFETVRRGPVAEIIDGMQSDPNQQRGEFVIMVSGASADTDVRPDREASSGTGDGDTSDHATGVGPSSVVTLELDRLIVGLQPHLSVTNLARCLAELTGRPKRSIYSRALALRDPSRRDTPGSGV